MKKHLLGFCVALLAFCTATHAQIQQGHYLIGGNLATSSVGFSDGTPFNLNITPKVAWFTNDNIAVGGFVDVGIATVKDGGTTFNYGVGPLARYYLGKSNVNTTTTSARASTRFFLEGTVGIQGVNISNGSSTNGLGIGIGPGLAYFLNDNISLETLLKYNKAFGFGNDDNGTSLLQLNFGFQIYLPRGSMHRQVEKITQ